jgi:26S proteasome regulatory subunit N1
MRIAVRIGDAELIKSTYEACADRTTKRQLAFMLARHRLFTVVEDEENADVLNHTNLSESFLTLGKDLDIMEAKTPEDIYKSNLSETRT